MRGRGSSPPAAARALALIGPVLSVAVSAPVVAHVGSSPQANNRYLTLVPEPGAVRVVYTLIFGDSPGAAARARMDRDGDGELSAKEQHAFGASMGGAIAAGLALELDGEKLDLAWDAVEVSIGTTSAAGRSFSVDLAATLCFEPAGDHVLRVVDEFRVPPVGEGALTIEPSGVEVARSAMGDGHGVRRTFKWMGRGPIADPGYSLAFVVPEGAERADDCAASGGGGTQNQRAEEDGKPASASSGVERTGGDGSARGPGRGGVAVAALAVMFAVVFAVGALRRRR